MGKHRNQSKQVTVNGKTIEGVYRDEKRGFYIFDPDKQGSDKRRSFGQGDHNLARAIQAIARQNFKLVPATSIPQARQELQAIGIDPDEKLVESWRVADRNEQSAILQEQGIPAQVIADAPDILTDRRFKIDPDLSDDKKADALANVLRIPPEKWQEHKKTASVNSDNPHGERLTLQQVSSAYLDWYIASRCDRQECETLASSFNEQAKKQNLEIAEKIAEKRKNGELVSVHTKSLRPVRLKKWSDFAPRKVKSRVEDHEKYWKEFVTWTKAKYGPLTVDQFKGEHFREYHSHVDQLSKSRRKIDGKKLANPEVWKNHRYNEVSATLRRAKRRYPDAAWTRGMFGEDGYLSILEKATPDVGANILLDPHHFKLLLKVADPQWKAILYLAMQASLSATDICDICWEHIDLENNVIRYRRGKNKNPRLTPLHPATRTALLEWKTVSKSRRPNIFVTWQGQPWEPKKIGTNGFDPIRKKVKDQFGVEIPGSIRSIRKTAPTCVQNALHDDRITQTLQGHETKSALRFYLNLPPDYMSKAVDVIAEKFF